MKEYLKPTAELILFDIKTLITAELPSADLGTGEDEWV